MSRPGAPISGACQAVLCCSAMTATLLDALSLLGNFDHRLLEIVGLSLRVSLSALPTTRQKSKYHSND